ncbi:MAG: hypothetical protein FWC26_08510 [Fibromonadales bacterium]|nr:hypothetical protein [Fibromonadales bacterium]
MLKKIFVFVVIIVVFVLICFIFVGCNSTDSKKTLIGQWDTIESNIARDLISDRIEFLNDGTGMSESSNLRGIGVHAESFTWRIDSDGRLILTAPTGIIHIYSIVKISKSILILEGNIPILGYIRTTYSKKDRKVKQASDGKTLNERISIILEIDKSGLRPDEVEGLQDRSLEIIRNRVEQYGLSKSKIFPDGDNRIAIELAGIDIENANKLVGGTAKLEFRIVAEQDIKTQTIASIDAHLPFSNYLVNFDSDLAVPENYIPKIQEILAMPVVQALIPRGVGFAWGYGFEEQSNGDKFKKLYLLKRRVEMDGKEIANAKPYKISEGLTAGQFVVSLNFKGIGSKKFSSVTGNNIGKQMAIVLDGQVRSAPVIHDRISNGEVQITGLDDMAEAILLAVVLQVGALPAPMKILEAKPLQKK